MALYYTYCIDLTKINFLIFFCFTLITSSTVKRLIKSNSEENRFFTNKTDFLLNFYLNHHKVFYYTLVSNFFATWSL